MKLVCVCVGCCTTPIIANTRFKFPWVLWCTKTDLFVFISHAISTESKHKENTVQKIPRFCPKLTYKMYSTLPNWPF